MSEDNATSDTCGVVVAGATARAGKGLVVPQCKCGMYEEKVFCGGVEVAERKFDAKQVTSKCAGKTPYCAKKAASGGFKCGLVINPFAACRPADTGSSKSEPPCSGRCSLVDKKIGFGASCKCSHKGEGCGNAFASGLLKSLSMGTYGSAKVDTETGEWWYLKGGAWESAGKASYIRESDVVTPFAHELNFTLNHVKVESVFGVPQESLKKDGKWDYCDARVAYLYHEGHK
jgi:hypothetical protein